MSAYPSQEFRPLKKPKFGPPDVFPQDSKQKEDELTATSVKHGFNNNPSIHDEHGSARNQNINQEKFGTEFISVLNKKQEINTFQDTTKKKQQPTKDYFWPAAKNQNAMRAWFKDLAGNKPLSSLGKKVPTFNKKEEIFSTLCEYSVPMVKAAWFIKMTTAYNVAMQENKTKQRRQIIDQSVEWCQAITKYLKDQLQKIQEPLGGAGATSSFLTVSQPDPNQALKQWHYVTKLAHHMYDEGLVDRHEFLSWLIDMLEKMKQSEDTVLKLLLNQVLLYLEEITLSTLLSRKLAHFSCKKLSQMINDADCAPPRTESPMLTNGGTGISSNQLMPQNPLLAVFAQYTNCPQHRGVVLSLSAILQVITFLCPSALVWNNLGEARSSNYLCASPLDLLPCPPSCLPMPPGPQNHQIRTHIRTMEHQICHRGRAAEVRWSSDKCQQSSKGFTISKILEVLDTLDRHNFERVDTNNTLDTLYNKIFANNPNKEGSEEDDLDDPEKPFVSDEPIIHLLIDWAVSTRRCGNYRAVVVAKLLEKRQNELRNEDLDLLECEGDMGDDVMVTSETPFFQNVLMSYLDNKAPTLGEKFGEREVTEEQRENMDTGQTVHQGDPVFQNYLMNYLDTQAPSVDENPTDDNRQGFANLIQLFSELIRHDIFSHDAYMCMLISRGDLLTSPSVMTVATDSIDLSSIKSQNESIKHEPQDDFKEVMDLQIGLESDLGTLFGSVKDEQKPSPEQPASVKSIKSEKDQNIPSVQPNHEVPATPKGPSRHMLYAQHFPIPQEESGHECNQRMVVLYGVGKARDDAHQVIKKIEKSALKMFHKRKCIDTSSADATMSKPKQNNEAKFESVFSKFQKLSYHDQYYVTTQCKNVVLDHIGNFLAGSSTYIPYVENVSYLFDMMEYSLNIYGLLDFSVQLLKDLSNVEEMLSEQNSSLCGSYTTSLCLCIVGIFRKYHSYLLVSQDLTIMAFEGLIGVVKKVCNPSDCSSSERCILAYLYDAYTSCSYLREKFQDMFSNAYRKMKMTLYATITPSASNKLWDPSFMVDCLNNINIKAPLDNNLIKQLNDNPANRYSFVCNAMLRICHCNSLHIEKLNEMSILCAELTARCNALSSEWLGVLQALCCSSNHHCGFIDILTQIDVSDMSIHDSLAVFTAILIARHCFSLQDLVVHVVLPSLLMARPSAQGDQDAEPGARLTCHILLRLFKTSDMVLTSPGPGVSTKNTCNIKGSCDKHLLDAAHDSIGVGPVLAILKAMLVLSDLCSDEMKYKSGSSSRKDDKEGDIVSMLLNHVNSVEDDGEMDMIMGTSKHKQGIENAGLSEFAKHALREMCRQDWVQEKFLKDPESVLNIDLLLDTMLSNKQAQQLLQMICYPNGVPNQVEGSEPDIKQQVQRILQTLDLWSFRVTLLELQLMFKQAGTQSETNVLLDNIARATIDLFHRQTEGGRIAGEREGIPPREMEKDAVWMVSPLINKLPSQVQGRVLKLSGSVLECGSSVLSKGREKEKSQRSKSLLSHQPFLSLVLSCMKGQEEQREALLSSLLSQLDKFMNNCKEALDKTPDEFKVRANIHEALSLRLSLVGGMFDTIQRNYTTEWAILLLQLVTNGIVDVQSNGELFTILLDMMCVLIHGSLIPEGTDKGEENTKAYMTLIKKLRRELGDKQSDSIDKIRQLLPLPKKFFEVISCETYGTQMDSKGNKYDGFGKKQGFQVAKKEKISPWEVIEGSKNPPPLSWPYFGAVKLEKKPLKYEEQHRLLLHHTHSLRQSLSHYLDQPVLPPEELEPPQEKHEDKPKESADTQVQEAAKRKTKPSKKNKRSSSGSGTYIQAPQRYNPSPWGYPPSQPPQHGAYSSYNPLSTGPSQGPRFESPPYMPMNPKVAIQNMIRTRHPGNMQNWNSSQNNPSTLAMIQKTNMQRMVRQQLRQQFQNRPMPDQGVFTGGSMQPPGMHGMSQPPGMSQNYGPSYNISQQSSMDGMPPSGGGMISQGYNQSYPAGQNPGMMQPMNSGPGYMSQQPTQQHFNPSSGRMMHSGGGIQTSNTMSGMSGGTSYNQMGPSGPPPQGSYMQNINPNMQNQQQQHLLQQQKLIQMRRQTMAQQQQQQQPMSQQRAAMMAQLQQQMPQPNPNQYNNYPNQPSQY